MIDTQRRIIQAVPCRYYVQVPFRISIVLVVGNKDASSHAFMWVLVHMQIHCKGGVDWMACHYSALPRNQRQPQSNYFNVMDFHRRHSRNQERNGSRLAIKLKQLTKG